ncbi:sensor histidine kinase [Marinobacterium aestuariivivens]|uniref:histidine kinase n=1 Tax=Marinobacterium aestuariivivens TaxID=1698799 RepID=A0ABW2A3Q4_9GAMM
MIRSKFAITRLVLLPYGTLLALYLLTVGGGGTWLYYQVRAVQTELVVDEVLTAIEPLASELRQVDAIAFVRQREPRLIREVETLFRRIPALRNIRIRGADGGVRLDSGSDGKILIRTTSPLPADTGSIESFSSMARRLHAESSALFLIPFDLYAQPATQIRLEFTFDRIMMLSRVNDGLTRIRHAVMGFGLAGALGILLALGITLRAMHMTRRLEEHFQEIYQRAALTGMAAQLVHSLRNPLAALRANVKALLVSPAQTAEIVEELDHDIVSLNDRLTAFLKLTRRHDEPFEPVDLRELAEEAARLAEPALAERGLATELDIPSGLSRPEVQRTAICDALVNLLHNAAESGQLQGKVRIRARQQGEVLKVLVEDSGRGIPADQLRHIFDAFYTTRADGNGLGLAIVQRILAAHGGRVAAESRKEGGARIVLTLPLRQQETPSWWNRLKKSFPT